MTTPPIHDWWLHIGRTVWGQWYGPVERRYIGRPTPPKAIVLHIQEGSSTGSWVHFHDVKASSHVFVNKDGSIWRLVPESDRAWTNGDVRSPNAKAIRLMNLYGWDPNNWTLTIETEGFTHEWPKAQEQLDAVVWQIRTWMERYDIPLEHVLRHADINSETRSQCPGDAFFAYVINELRNDAGHAVSPAPSLYVEARPVMNGNGRWDGLKDVKVNDVVFHADKRQVTTSVNLNRRQWASTASDLTGPVVPANTKANVLGWCNGEEIDGERRWWIGSGGSRLWVGGTVEKPSVSQPHDGPDQDPREHTPVVLNGVVFYHVGEHGEGRNVTLTSDAHKRRWAGSDSASLGVVEVGSTVTAYYWCIGEEVDKEKVWWVLGKDLHSAPRMWSGATDSRPL